MTAALLPLALLAAQAASAADSTRPLRYDLRPGDHLVYRQVLEEELDGRTLYGLPGRQERTFGPAVQATRHAEWTSHLLVLDEQDGALIVGFQRNRTDARVVRYLRDDEADAAGERELDTRTRGEPERFAQANRFSRRGESQLPAVLVREWSSKALWALDELPTLPPQVLEVGGSWQGEEGLPFRYRAAAWETMNGERCLRAEGELTASSLLTRDAFLADTVHTRWWFCPTSGIVSRIELDVTYPNPAFQRVRQRVRIDLQEHRRGESLSTWLGDPELQQAAIAALLVSDRLLTAPQELYALLSGPEPVRRGVLGLAFRAGLPPPPLDTLAALLKDPSSRVRALASRLLDAAEPRAAAEALLATAGQDPHAAVRRAAARRPSAGLSSTASSSHAPAICSAPSTSDGAAADPLSHGWQPPGTTLRPMQTAEFAGRPFGVHVPLDYRGDEPFPLLVYLAGNGGPVLEAALLAEAAASESGYLVVYPHAGGYWWDPGVPEMVEALIGEVMRTFNVDADRVYLSGLSNGGTGTYYYATLWPHRFTAAVSAMGAGQSRFEAADAPPPPFPGNASHLPFLFLHGEEDDVIPADATLQTARLMHFREAALEVHVFPRRGHELLLGTGEDGRTFEFLERHGGRPSPRKLDFRTRSPSYGRHYWVDVLELDGETARVGAEITPDGEVRLETEDVARLRLLLAPELVPTDGTLRVTLNGRVSYEGPVVADCALWQSTLQASGDPYLAYAAELTLDVRR